MKNILIIGGYGAVGRLISTHLAQEYPKKVIVAGRNLEKAQQLARQLNDEVIPLQFDVSKWDDEDVLEDIGLVVMCIDLSNKGFLDQCIRRGIDYVDITASQRIISEIEKLATVAQEYRSRVVLSVGLAPGITNLLARQCINKSSKRDWLNIFILLGLGEKHGEFAYRWTFDHMHTKYDIQWGEVKRRVKSFTEPVKVDLIGEREFYLFNFSDQHSLSKSTSIKKVLTRMAFDSQILTKLFALMRMIGVTRLLKIEWVQRMLIKLFNKVTIGSDVYAVKVVSGDGKDIGYSCRVSGKGEGQVTAYTAILTVKYLMQNPVRYGVSHLDEIITDIPEFINQLKIYDEKIEINF